jgi:hypothetical protein
MTWTHGRARESLSPGIFHRELFRRQRGIVGLLDISGENFEGDARFAKQIRPAW